MRRTSAIGVSRKEICPISTPTRISCLTNASKGNPGGDLRAVCDRIEKKAVVLVVDAQCPITDLSEDAMRDVDTNDALDLPHQIGAGSEPSNLAPHGGVKYFVKIVAATQSDVGIEPVIAP